VISIAVIDDHPVFRQGLAQAVDVDDMALALTAASVEDFDARVVDLPEVVILDLGLPGMRGGQAVEHLCRRGMKVLVVSAQGERESVVDAMGAGASGYLTKSSEPAEITAAVRAIANGQTYVSPTLASYLLQSAKGKSALDLSAREGEVLRWLAKGLTDVEIGERMFISVSGVRGHLDRIRDKTGVRRRTLLAQIGLGLERP
jgi:DNA-binding NarL/FixJ family response regulator